MVATSENSWTEQYPQVALDEAFREIPEEHRTPENFFIEVVEGELYPIPRTLTNVDMGYGTGDYTLTETGGCISQFAEVRGEVTVGGKTVIGPSVRLLGQTTIGRRVKIEAPTEILNSSLDDYVEVGSNSSIVCSKVGGNSLISERTDIKDSDIGASAVIRSFSRVHGSRIGSGSSVGERTKVYASDLGSKTTVGDSALVKGVNTHGNKTAIGRNATVENVVMGADVKIEDHVFIPEEAGIRPVTLGSRSRVLDFAYIKPGRQIPESTVIVPRLLKVKRENKQPR